MKLQAKNLSKFSCENVCDSAAKAEKNGCGYCRWYGDLKKMKKWIFGMDKDGEDDDDNNYDEYDVDLGGTSSVPRPPNPSYNK